MKKTVILLTVVGFIQSGCLNVKPTIPDVNHQFTSMKEDVKTSNNPEIKKKNASKRLNRQAYQAILDQDFVRAETLLLEALELQPENLSALTNLGAVFEKTNRPIEARRMYRKAILANPKALLKAGDPTLRKGKGKALLEIILGNWNRAEPSKNEALTLEASATNGQTVYRDYCAQKCHASHGWGKKDGTYPQIAGQYKNVLIKQLLDIRHKNRDNPEMYRYSLPSEIGGVQNIADVSAFLETMPMSINNGKGPGDNLEHGKTLYNKDCARCHKVDGSGDANRFYELLYGQHYNYLVRQFQWILNKKRRNAHPLMIIQAESYTNQDISAVMDYISRLPIPEEKQHPSPDKKNVDDQRLDKNVGELL